MLFTFICQECEKEFPEDEEEQKICSKCVFLRDIGKDSEQLKKLRKAVADGKNIVGLGPGGCGKSYTLQQITSQLKYTEPRGCFDVVGPTGMSALNVAGITFHSLFAFSLYANKDLFFHSSPHKFCNPDASDEELMEKMLDPRFKIKFKRIKDLNMLIFDEFSMVSALHFQTMNRICQLIKGNSRPFGGIQLILFGDPFQLRPVKGDYIFTSKCWTECDFNIHDLTIEFSGHLSGKLYRFSTKEFSDMTRLIRLGIISNQVKEALQTREQIEPPESLIELHFKNSAVDEVNQREYDKLEALEHLYECAIAIRCFWNISDTRPKLLCSSLVNDSSGKCDLSYQQSPDTSMRVFLSDHKKRIQSLIDSNVTGFRKNLEDVYGKNYMCMKLKPGARVVCTMNIKAINPASSSNAVRSLLYANGTTGIIRECHDDYIMLEQTDGTVIRIDRTFTEYDRRISIDQHNSIDIKLHFDHFPIRLGYASTLHKSQGMTLNMVKINGKNLNKQSGILYVALSRCRSFEAMYIENLNYDQIQASYSVIQEFRSHYEREIDYLWTEHPDWFDSFYINTDTKDKTAIQELYKTIHIRQAPAQNEKIQMPSTRDTRSIRETTTRGSSQAVIREWLLLNQKTCLLTQESLPALLEFAHIRSHSSFDKDEDPHIGNAILLRRDVHALFDSGYFGIDIDGTMIQSQWIAGHADYSHYKKIAIPPWVNPDFLKWHKEHVFRTDI